MNRQVSGESLVVASCLGWFIGVLIFNLTLGSICAHYVISVWLEKDVSYLWAAIIGLFGGELTVPAAIITWLLRMAGAI